MVLLSIKNLWLPLWLVIFWLILWGSVTPLTVIGGILVMVIVLAVFRMPSISVTDRFNPFYMVYAFLWFIKELFVASFNVTKVAITQGKNVKNAIIGVQMLPTSPVITTVTSQFVTLVPGSSVIDIDYTNSIMYLHVLDCKNEKDIDKIRCETREIQGMTIKAMGTKADMKLLKEGQK